MNGRFKLSLHKSELLIDLVLVNLAENCDVVILLLIMLYA